MHPPVLVAARANTTTLATILAQSRPVGFAPSLPSRYSRSTGAEGHQCSPTGAAHEGLGRFLFGQVSDEVVMAMI